LDRLSQLALAKNISSSINPVYTSIPPEDDGTGASWVLSLFESVTWLHLLVSCMLFIITHSEWYVTSPNGVVQAVFVT